MTTDETVTQLTGRIATLEYLLARIMPYIDRKLDRSNLILGFPQHSPVFHNLEPKALQAAEETINRIFSPEM